MATENAFHTAPDTRPGRCWECGGPCATYKGTVHGWRCTACIDRHLTAAQTAFDAQTEKIRAKAVAKMRAGP